MGRKSSRIEAEFVEGDNYYIPIKIKFIDPWLVDRCGGMLLYHVEKVGDRFYQRVDDSLNTYFLTLFQTRKL